MSLFYLFPMSFLAKDPRSFATVESCPGGLKWSCSPPGAAWRTSRLFWVKVEVVFWQFLPDWVWHQGRWGTWTWWGGCTRAPSSSLPSQCSSSSPSPAPCTPSPPPASPWRCCSWSGTSRTPRSSAVVDISAHNRRGRLPGQRPGELPQTPW